MTYNVWCREDLVVHKRMKAIGDLVQEHSPDVIFFQEITPYIHSIFESFAWWKDYHCSPVPTEGQFCLMLSKLRMESYARWKFGTSPTGKCYLEADIVPGPPSLMKPIRIATTELECPVPPAWMHLRERYTQAKHAVSALSSADNVVLGGDMSWDDDADLPFPLPGGWCDAWEELIRERGSYYSWTYDSFWVEKVWEFNGHIVHRPWTKKRSDRFVCKLQDYTLNTIQLIEGNHGFEAFGRIRCTNYTTCNHEDLALHASCHRGLVLTIVPK
ncbi:unnamed protein product [Triticum turgidum subsp. durum]|uniref:Endonuclease/exonuclease/phosphatase domain-containing protein n=3 Tax=Triticum TaxID=4564 RepID=A0A9R1QWQ7_TRITD|nr:unnamed protein product [Triticum turgidum subsp. durum]